MPWDNPRIRKNIQDGESDATRDMRFRLFCRGVNVSRYAALPEDEGLDERARKGLEVENIVVYGRTWADHAIKNRIFGNVMRGGKKDI
jgi:hypothetical protein